MADESFLQQTQVAVRLRDQRIKFIDIEYNDISLSKLEETIKGYHPEFDKIVDIKQLFDPDQVIHIYERTRGWSGGPR